MTADTVSITVQDPKSTVAALRAAADELHGLSKAVDCPDDRDAILRQRQIILNLIRSIRTA